MAITTWGWQGTVGELQRAKTMAAAAPDSVGGPTHWQLSQGTGRQVVAAPGLATAADATSELTSPGLSLSLPTPTNGGFYAIVRRINWATKAVTLEYVTADTTSTTTPTKAPTLLPTLNSSPGVLYDHFLGWAWVNSANTNVVIFDGRTQPPGVRLAALEARRITVADLNALKIAEPMAAGTEAYVLEGGATFTSDGTKFVQTSQATFTTTGTRDTAYAKASGAYRVQGKALAYCADVGYVTEWLSAYNSSTNVMGGFIGGVAADGWHSLADSGWANVGGSGNSAPFGGTFTAAASGGFPVGSFRRLGRLVAIRGTFANVNAWGGGDTLFTLPPGFRPPATVEIVERVGGTVNGIDVLSTGAVTSNLPGGAGATALPVSAVFPLD